jgi:hypothetical protein
MSVFPTNFLKYLSAPTCQSSQECKSTQHRLTQSPTFHFLRRDRKDGQYLDHNINSYVRHSRSWCDASVNLKPLEKSFDAVKEVDKFVLASADIFSRLRVRVLK